MAECPIKLPLRLKGNLIIDAEGKRLCALFDWFVERGVEKSISKAEVKEIGKWMVATLNSNPPEA
jgi:hypothetical protein